MRQLFLMILIAPGTIKDELEGYLSLEETSKKKALRCPMDGRRDDQTAPLQRSAGEEGGIKALMGFLITDLHISALLHLTPANCVSSSNLSSEFNMEIPHIFFQSCQSTQKCQNISSCAPLNKLLHFCKTGSGFL